jgi:beta-glucosidase-like glycosyl hydrolase
LAADHFGLSLKRLRLKMFKVISLILALIVSVGCSENRTTPVASFDEEQSVGPTGFYAAEKTSSNLKVDNDVFTSEEMQSLRKKIGTSFLVEQFNVKVFSTMQLAIKNHPPAGLVYWNPDNSEAIDLAKVNAAYSLEAEKYNTGPLLLSTDYEGGGLRLSISGKSIPGIQRFTKGFTQLAHPSWLGRSLAKFGTEMCELHGKIMAKELKMVGINYPLATISDLAKNLFSVRGISSKPENISTCMKKILQAFHDEQNMILVTKHFPGLGETSGDTHDGTVVSKAELRSELDSSIKPFKDIISFANSLSVPESLSVLASHALYKPLDPDQLTTVSKKILTDFLRDELHYQGLVLSDAMWMGEYGLLKTDQLLKVYLKSILAGMDLLMISGRTFVPAVTFFRDIFDGKTSMNLQTELEEELGLSFSEIRRLYINRLKQSSERLAKTQQSLKYAHLEYDVEQYKNPNEYTVSEGNRYLEIFEILSTK